MEPVVLFRKNYRDEGEFDVAQKYFNVLTNGTACKNQLVIGRYSCLPYYRELEKDLQYNGCRLVNTHNQHSWIADFGYYYDFKGYTPQSWNDDNFPLCNYTGPFVVKGKTNSRKHQWRTHMFAENKKRAIEIACELRNDGLLCDQGIIYRKYEPLKILEVDFNGLPLANEWRFFYYKYTRLSYGFYWSSGEDDTLDQAEMNDDGLAFADHMAAIACDHADFFVLDIAQKFDGSWILIEINDAQQSGLSENNADILYSNLRDAIKHDETTI